MRIAQPSMRTQTRVWSTVAAAVLAIYGATAAAADNGSSGSDPGRWAFVEENDALITTQDRHYTQGGRFSYLLPTLSEDGFWQHSFDTIGYVLPMFRRAPEAHRQLEWIALSQSIFTPDDLSLSVPDPHDRPYAAWLTTGLDWIQENHGKRLHSFEVLAGVTGPAALGREAQDGFHQGFGFGNAEGWSHQLGNRAAFQVSYDYRERLGYALSGNYGVDLVPEAGVSLGTVLRYVDAGLTLRFGNALQADYGAERIRPASNGTAYFNPHAIGKGFLHYYVYLGAQTRRVFYNRFIDGAEDVSPTPITRRVEVTDTFAGAELLFPYAVRLDFTATRRTSEYTQQPAQDVFGSATVSIPF